MNIFNEITKMAPKSIDLFFINIREVKFLTENVEMDEKTIGKNADE